MNVLVVGASGATGRLLVRQLLERGANVRAIVRAPERLPEDLLGHDCLSVIVASVSELDDRALAGHVTGCDVVASCLGHNVDLRGIFGPPHRLVRDTVRRLCNAIRARGAGPPVRFVLMSSTGVRNPDRNERVSLAQRFVLAALRVLVPPHADNEETAEVLRVGVGPDDPSIEWAAVRPDNLVDAEDVTPYDVHPSPIRSAIFDAGQTSRINVAHFMAELSTDDAAWTKWKGRMPVLYNRTAGGSS